MLIYDTLRREKREFKPVHPNEVRMYTCGPTVYNYIHIGNARPLIIFDVIRRYFEYLGYKVTYVQNITDIDDKIISQAIEESTTTEEIAKRYTKYFQEDCEKLGVKPPTHAPKATGYVEKMIDLIKTLVDKGYAYEVEGNVFFEVSEYHEYGRLSGKDLKQMEIGERVDDVIRGLKKAPGDFTLWKPAKPGEPSWESPWGRGRPGWHTECVVMSTTLLGKEFDIHTGGIDLIFPHHENEIAQARCGSDAPFAKYWMHNEFVNLKDKKMAKSEGNVILVRNLVKEYRKEAIRLLFLQTHYRKQISFSYEALEGCQSLIEKFKYYYSGIKKQIKLIQKNKFKKSEHKKPWWYNRKIREIDKAMNKDFNTAIVVSIFFYILYKTYFGPEEFKFYGKKLLDDLDSFLGILPRDEKKTMPFEKIVKNKINRKIKLRDEYRKNKDWEKADKIRDELLQMDIILEDTKNGTKWRIKL
ncbi:hypothetical protein AMJ80_07820 [bacterium SM23_31]|nr:MAG: hypothetical protein AMJ80_07820 [bacterium SM23_31]